MELKRKQPGVTREETLVALTALGEDADASRVEAVQAKVRLLPAAEGVSYEASVQAAVDVARRQVDATAKAGYVSLPAYAASFDDAERYNGPVRSKLMLFLPVTSFRPEALRVSERRSEYATWHEVETYDPRRSRWIEQKSHADLVDAVGDARGWYPDPLQGVSTVKFEFNDRAQGIFADGFKDRCGEAVGDTFAYRYRAALYGAEGRDWSKEQLADLVGLYSSDEMATLMGVEPRSRYGEPIMAYVTIGEREWPFFTKWVDGARRFCTQDHDTSYVMQGEAMTPDTVAALRAQYGEQAVRPVGFGVEVSPLRDVKVRVSRDQLRKASVDAPMVHCVGLDGRLSLTNDMVRVVLLEAGKERVGFLCDSTDNTGVSVTNAPEEFIRAAEGHAWPLSAPGRATWVARDRTGECFRLTRAGGEVGFEKIEAHAALAASGMSAGDAAVIEALTWAGIGAQRQALARVQSAGFTVVAPSGGAQTFETAVEAVRWGRQQVYVGASLEELVKRVETEPEVHWQYGFTSVSVKNDALAAARECANDTTSLDM